MRLTFNEKILFKPGNRDRQGTQKFRMFFPDQRAILLRRFKGNTCKIVSAKQIRSRTMKELKGAIGARVLLREGGLKHPLLSCACNGGQDLLGPFLSKEGMGAYNSTAIESTGGSLVEVKGCTAADLNS